MTAEIDELESKLRLLKKKRKNRMEEIEQEGEFSFPTDSLTIAFKRTK